MKDGEIAGLVAGVVIGALILCTLACNWCTKRRPRMVTAKPVAMNSADYDEGRFASGGNPMAPGGSAPHRG